VNEPFVPGHTLSATLYMTGRVCGLEEWRRYVFALRDLGVQEAKRMDPTGTPSGNDTLDNAFACSATPDHTGFAALARIPLLSFVWVPDPLSDAPPRGRWQDGFHNSLSPDDTRHVLQGDPPIFAYTHAGDTGFFDLPAPVVEALRRDGAFLEHDHKVWCATCGHSCGGCGTGFGDTFADWIQRQGLSAHVAMEALGALHAQT
jgi:hypothetical protein